MEQRTKNYKITIPEGLHVKFKTRLMYDNLTSMAFFSYIIEEYINNSEIMVQVVSDILEKRKLRSSRLLKNKRKTAEMGRTNFKNVFLSEEEISDVYDILERYDIDEV